MSTSPTTPPLRWLSPSTCNNTPSIGDPTTEKLLPASISEFCVVCVCVCVCVCAFACVHVCVCVCVCNRVETNISSEIPTPRNCCWQIYPNSSRCVHVCVRVCACVRVRTAHARARVCVLVYVCACVYAYVCVCMKNIPSETPRPRCEKSHSGRPRTERFFYFLVLPGGELTITDITEYKCSVLDSTTKNLLPASLSEF